MTEPAPLKSRKGLYRIQDQFFKFWFRYVLPNRARIEEGRLENVLSRIRTDFPTLVAENYERLTTDIVKTHENRLFPIENAGRWWTKNEEIDLAAFNEERREVLFGEVKWSARPVRTDIYGDLKRKAALVDWHSGERTGRFCLFSKSGFTEAMLDLARKESVILFHKGRWIAP